MSSRWAVLALLCLARMSMGLHLQVVAAVAPFLAADLGLSYGEIGLLIGLFLFPGVFLALPGGLISRRIGDKATLVAALGLLFAGTGLLALSRDFGPALAARLLSGAGGTLLTMQVAKIATDWFAGRELATAIGLLLATFPLGVALAMASLGLVAAASSWQVAVAAIAATAVPILAVVLLLYRDLPRQADETENERPRWLALGARELGLVLLAGAAFSLVNAALVVFTSFTPTLLIERGRSAPEAGLETSWASWALIGSVGLGGYLLDRVGRGLSWLLGSTLLSAVACLALVAGEPAWLWIVLYGVVSAPVVVGSMALPGQVLKADGRSVGFGLFFTMNYLGFALLPAGAGFLLDLTGETTAPLWFSGAMYVAIVPLLVLFRRLASRGQGSP